MTFLSDADRVYEYIGGIFRAAAAHPEVGSELAAIGIVMQIYVSDPDASITVRFEDPITVQDGGADPEAGLIVRLSAEIAHRYWRGEYNLAVGLAKGKIEVTGPVDVLQTIALLTRPLFPVYRDMVEKKPSGDPERR